MVHGALRADLCHGLPDPRRGAQGREGGPAGGAADELTDLGDIEEIAELLGQLALRCDENGREDVLLERIRLIRPAIGHLQTLLAVVGWFSDPPLDRERLDDVFEYLELAADELDLLDWCRWRTERIAKMITTVRDLVEIARDELLSLSMPEEG